jgi:acylphosphatase
MPMKHVHLTVLGTVQGVGFRYSAQDQAVMLGLAGYVRNESDGSVAIDVEGESDTVNRFVDWCRHGPRGARVSRLDCEEGPIRGFDSFEITF